MVTVAPLPNEAELTSPEILHVGTVILNRKDGVLSPALAVRLAVCAAVTAATRAVKLTLDAPAGTTVVAGTVTLGLLLESATLTPPDGATAVKARVQVAVPGAVTVAGEQFTEPN
jgi:hypothetical protein